MSRPKPYQGFQITHRKKGTGPKKVFTSWWATAKPDEFYRVARTEAKRMEGSGSTAPGIGLLPDGPNTRGEL